MGLDISIRSNMDEEILSPEFFEDKELQNEFKWSRKFCNFMCRENVTSSEPELEQIGRITQIDIKCLEDMLRYCDELCTEYKLEYAENEIEKKEMLENILNENSKVNNNIDTIIFTISELLSKLKGIDNLNQLLDDGGEDTLGYEFYFTDFNLDKGDGYTGNTFGQDLRSILKYLNYLKKRNVTTVWFEFM